MGKTAKNIKEIKEIEVGTTIKTDNSVIIINEITIAGIARKELKVYVKFVETLDNGKIFNSEMLLNDLLAIL